MKPLSNYKVIGYFHVHWTLSSPVQVGLMKVQLLSWGNKDVYVSFSDFGHFLVKLQGDTNIRWHTEQRYCRRL